MLQLSYLSNTNKPTRKNKFYFHKQRVKFLIAELELLRKLFSALNFAYH